jgi:hypothetical protein
MNGKIEELKEAAAEQALAEQADRQFEDEQRGRALMLEEQVRFQNGGVPVEAILGQ